MGEMEKMRLSFNLRMFHDLMMKEYMELLVRLYGYNHPKWVYFSIAHKYKIEQMIEINEKLLMEKVIQMRLY